MNGTISLGLALPSTGRRLARRCVGLLARVLDCRPLTRCGGRQQAFAALLATSLMTPALLVAQEQPPAEGEAASGPRWTIAVGGGLLTTSDAPAGTFSFDHALFGPEQADFDADYAGGDASHVEFSIGVRLRSRLALGITWSESSLTDNVDVAARLPHPFLYDAHRTVEGNSGGLSRDETALHLSLRWAVRDGEKVQVALFGGPTQVDLSYDLVSVVRFDQSYPFDTASYTGVEKQGASGDAVGYHVGADVVRWFGQTFGIGLLARYSQASVDLDAPDGSIVSVDAGGVQAAVDLRFRF